MAYSYVVYTGNGSTTQFAITFPYIRKEHVKVYVNYVDTAYTYVNDTTVQLATAPASPLRVEVRRVTPLSTRLVDYTDGSTLVAADLDTSNLQSLYNEQELDDSLKQTVSIDPATGLPSAGNQRITNVANPVNAQDAATKTYVDTADALKVAKAGDSMTGALAMGSNKITGLGTPTANADAATKAYVDTVTLAGNVPDGDRGDITVSGVGTSWTIDTGAVTSAKILDGTIVNADVNASAGIVASKLAFTQAGTGAVARTVDSKLKDVVSVKDFGAVGNGFADDTAAFAAARAVTNQYYIPTGTYVLSASPDPFLDCYTSASNVTLIVGGTSYNCSNAFAGPLRYVAVSAQKTNIVHSKTNKIIQYWQDGSPGTATGFYRGLAFTTDSHWAQAQPATNGGSTDFLWQRSTLNADAGGNRFNETFTENLDRLDFSYATTAAGFPSFDSAIQIYAGANPSLVFAALPLDMKHGYTIQSRALGALKIQNYPTSDTAQVIRDVTTNNVLQKTSRSMQRLAGIGMDTLYDTPNGVTGPRMYGAVFSDLASGDAEFPVTKNIWDTTGATRNQVIGILRVAAQSSGGAGSYRESRFVFNGTTVTITDIVNTLPAQFVATIAVSGTNLQFQGSYSGGLGDGYTVTVSIEWCSAGR